jgi:hypothetical protein
METQRFDQWTRLIATDASRRTLLRGVVGPFLAMIIAAGSGGVVGAACRKVGQQCEQHGNCCPGARCQGRRCQCPAGRKPCGGRCIPRRQCCTNRDCPGKICRRGACVCRLGTGDCNGDGQCESLLADTNDCLRCGRTCPGGRCFNGACGGDEACVCPSTCAVCYARAEGGRVCSDNGSGQCRTNRRCQRDADCPPGSGCGQVVCGSELVSFCTNPC